MSIRLQKYLARAGVASRRASEAMIAAGRVRVNGRVADELGFKVCDEDIVELDGKVVELPRENVTIMLNKPVGFLTSMSDPFGRPTVADLAPISEYPSLFPVGRLDMDTSGLLLFTTDGELGNRLLHPKYHVEKTYIASLSEEPPAEQLAALCRGVMLEDGPTAPARVRVLSSASADLSNTELGTRIEIIIHEGRKRQVRRMFDAIGYKVEALHRESFGGLSLNGLESGNWRKLGAEEISILNKSATP